MNQLLCSVIRSGQRAFKANADEIQNLADLEIQLPCDSSLCLPLQNLTLNQNAVRIFLDFPD